MIVIVHSAGKSFKGLGTYLTHDPDAKTAERVGWTHTLNLAHDFAPLAIDEMLWTARNAELLKQEAGIRAGGRATENSAMHISFNWSPDETPTKDHMIETAEGFLRHMNWQEHQAILVAHEDKHPHAHMMLNAIHPETGLRLDDNFERRRAQAWALQYEQENGRIFCEQRLQNVGEREDAPTRPTWMAFQKNQIEFENQEKHRENQTPIIVEELNNPDAIKSTEWNKLKEIQRHERLTFFAEGKLEFSELRQSIYREIREEFRESWSDYYSAVKDGGVDKSELAVAKQNLIAEQKAALDARRDDACQALRASRDERYQTLLDDQREARYGLGARQEAGLDNAPLLYLMEEGKIRAGHTNFQEAAAEASKAEERAEPPEEVVTGGPPERDSSGMKSGADIGVGIGAGAGFALISFFDSLADGLIGGKPAPKPRPVEPSEPRPDPFDGVIAAARERERTERLQADEDETRKKQRSYGE